MMSEHESQLRPESLLAAGLPAAEVAKFAALRPSAAAMQGTGPEGYGRMLEQYLTLGERLWRRMPPKAKRGPLEAEAVTAIQAELGHVRESYLRYQGEELYRALTGDYAVGYRLRDLLREASLRFPGLVPTLSECQAEGQRKLQEKEGVERAQAILLAQLLGLARPGAHLVEMMLRPRPESESLLAEWQRTGHLDMGTARIERQGKIGILTHCNERYLNAEDDGTVDALEIATDLLHLDPAIEVGVMRGGPVPHSKHQGRRVFNAGINLTHLYHGRISYTYFLTREMGFVNKIYRGLCLGDCWAHEPERTLEMVWLGAVDAFAIGGGCQLLPVFDHVIAEAGSYFNLPARKEGIIPGAANLRLPRLVGDRLARQAVLFEREFEAESPAGQLLCDAVVPSEQMDAAISQTALGLVESGPVSSVANRRALRVIQEPIDAFRAYMAVYAREQADCYLSPALVRNLEVNWGAQNRQP